MSGDANTYADPYRVAIYTGPQSDALEDDPYVDLSRVKFHSDLPYTEIVSTVSGTVDLPKGSPAWYPSYLGRKVVLFDHGLDYTPLFFGQLSGVKFEDVRRSIPAVYLDVPMSGSVPIGHGWEDGYINGFPRNQCGREVNFGADETSIFIWDAPSSPFYTVPSDYNQGTDHQALPVTLSYVVFVTNVEL
jgi:hypothetical protein